MKEVTTVTTSKGERTFELTATRMKDSLYSATKKTWLKILKAKTGADIHSLRFRMVGSRMTGWARKEKSGAIQFGCCRFTPTAVNTIRTWAGLRALPAKSRKTRKTR